MELLKVTKMKPQKPPHAIATAAVFQEVSNNLITFAHQIFITIMCKCSVYIAYVNCVVFTLIS